MKHLMKQLLVCALSAFYFTGAFAQKEFFRSKQEFTPKQMERFISSLTMHGNLLLFNANDYNLYVYDKDSGLLRWSYETSYKSSVPAFVQDNHVYAGGYVDKIERALQLDLHTGKFIKALPFGPLATKPFVKNGMLYGTAIYDFGSIFGYDLSRDTVTWSRFIAHGYSVQPYYYEDKILANAEANNWFSLGYDGILRDTTCVNKASMYVQEIPCIKVYSAITHDGKELKGRIVTDIMGDDMYGTPPILTSKKFTFILYDDKLTILSNKLKVKEVVDIVSLAGDIETNYDTKFLQADDEYVWLLYGNHLLQYNHKTKKMLRTTDLSAWTPYSVLTDENNIWLISGKDGLLYGLSL